MMETTRDGNNIQTECVGCTKGDEGGDGANEAINLRRFGALFGALGVHGVPERERGTISR